MTSADTWLDYPGDLSTTSVSRREERCTWHGTKAERCPEPPVKVVRDTLNRRWSACARAVDELRNALDQS